MRLAAFEGLWTLTRRIEDVRAGATGHFEGRARFTAVPGGLAYLEEGELVLGAARPMRASRRYFWREMGPEVEVDFSDGRFFHAFPVGAERPAATHYCAPDQYSVRYDFAAWPDWRAEWRAVGPRKDYAMISDYRRAG
ncbi:MAG: trigger factor [Rhodovulum sulfidophilum]|uniref:Trigger factor n=1 Tax=Rhodovulum sulfidophilum TaxID=35806 RepID=A0A2W5NCT9_RHOSU|nr:MAG: trigger factor [Rhodovulum sulfidophilum]